MTIKKTAQLVNKDILEDRLGFKQHSRSIIFLKANTLIFSPSAQNQYNWFDVRKPNLDFYLNTPSLKGFLIIRFFDAFLVAELDDFIKRMMPNDKFVFTKSIGPHWKFRIRKNGRSYSIYNQQNSAIFYPIKEYSANELEKLLQ
ncbi:hypothetical protein H1Q58_14845 [Planococcus maritimus]|uniref:Uncharacterized protein n=1 Tax=Planococcus maritimus TaxID=192421 RepID=A0A7D7R9L5_PLAMR|nr:hypothetical protein [Planococcus maritimus]QMT17218.1 hypothetical protein H1Q58_14845 [Planococcus maritimus]